MTIQPVTSRGRRERGQALPALALIVAGLVAFTVFVMVPLGSANDRRAQTRTAADAASLAAVDSAAESIRGIGSLLLPGLGGPPGSGNGLLDLLDGLEAEGQAAALEYAARNDAELVDFRMTVSLAGARPVIEAYAATRSDRQIESTDSYAHAEATARTDVLGGLCGIGGVWGIDLDDGTCRSITDLLDPLPEPTPTPTPTETDDEDDEDEEEEPAPTPTPPDLPEPQPLRVTDPFLVD
jgi:hypothetical protein